MSDYVPVYHPITGKFVCKIDMERGIMFVKDRGYISYIDLTQTQTRSDNCGRGETLQVRQSVQDECGTHGSAGMAGDQRSE